MSLYNLTKYKRINWKKTLLLIWCGERGIINVLFSLIILQVSKTKDYGKEVYSLLFSSRGLIPVVHWKRQRATEMKRDNINKWSRVVLLVIFSK